MVSILNSDIYEQSDLRKAIEDKDFDLAGQITFQFSEIASLKIAHSSPFISSFMCRVHKYVSYKLLAPAAVLITSNNKKTQLNLFLNPIMINDFFSVTNDKPEEFYDHFTALMKHEMLHLIWEHQQQEENYFGTNINVEMHRLYNIAQDSKINESYELKNDTWIQKTGITYDALVDYGYNESYETFLKENWLTVASKLDINKIKEQTNQNNNVLNVILSDENSDDTNKTLTNDIDVLQSVPSDAKDSRGNSIDDDQKIANGSQAGNEVEKIIKDAIAESNTPIEELKSRNIIPGHIINRIFNKVDFPEVIDIRDYYRHGVNVMLKTMKCNRHKMKFNSRQFNFKYAKKHEKGARIIAYIDTSGSMKPEEIEFFLSQILEISKEYHCPLTAIPWSTKVNREFAKEIKSKNDISELKFQSGGTCANSVFKDLKQQNYSPENEFIIILTDGYTEEISPENYGKYANSVLWVLDNEHGFNLDKEKQQKMYPGSVVYLNDDKHFVKLFPDRVRN